MSSVYWIRHQDHTDIFSQGYVGVSNNIANRFEEHRNRPSNAHLKHAIEKYSWDKLIKEIVVIAEDSYCYEIEAKLRNAEKIGWNLTFGGGKPPVAKKGRSKGRLPWNKGKKASLEARLKMSESAKKRMENPEERKHISQALAGRVLSEETKAKISISRLGIQTRLGHTNSQETNKKISQKLIGNTNGLGYKHSEKAKSKMALARAGKSFPMASCIFCQKTGGVIPMKRWHMDNCKFKEAE